MVTSNLHRRIVGLIAADSPDVEGHDDRELMCCCCQTAAERARLSAIENRCAFFSTERHEARGRRDVFRRVWKCEDMSRQAGTKGKVES